MVDLAPRLERGIPRWPTHSRLTAKQPFFLEFHKISYAIFLFIINNLIEMPRRPHAG